MKHKIILLFALYIIIHFTLLGRESTGQPKINMQLFWTLEAAVKTGNLQYWYYLVGNIILFVPLGFSLASMLVFRKKWLLVLGICFGVSLLVEVLQYVLRIGLCEADDLLHNTLGGFLGYVVYAISNILDEKRQ